MLLTQIEDRLFADRHLNAKANLAVARTPLAIDLFPAGRFVTQALAERGEHAETRQSSAALFLYGISAVTVDPMKVLQDAWL